MAFTSLAAVKTLEGIADSDTSQDDAITAAVNAVEKMFLRHFGGLTSTDVTSYTEYHDGQLGESEIRTERWPLVEVTALTDYEATINLTHVYASEEGYVTLKPPGMEFYEGRRNVVVTFTAGWVTVPDDLARAATVLAHSMWQTDPQAGLKNERIGRWAYTLADSDSWPATVRRVLFEDYARPMVT